MAPLPPSDRNRRRGVPLPGPAPPSRWLPHCRPPCRQTGWSNCRNRCDLRRWLHCHHQIGIAGEACHFLDLLRHLAGSPTVALHVVKLDGQTAAIAVTYADGSIATIHYLANGHKGFPKERLEVFCGGRILQLNHFRTLRAYGWPGFRTMRLWRQDKGANACAAAFLKAVREGQPSPIPFEELVEVARFTLQAAGGE